MGDTGFILVRVGETTNVPAIGDTAWTNPGNVTADDNTGATCTTPNTTQWLVGRDCGFSIPDNATILGIEVQQKAKAAPGSFWMDYVRIVKGGNIGATNRGDSGKLFGLFYLLVSYGGAADLWGETWTAADINSSGFGVALAGIATTYILDFDYLKIRVYYQVGIWHCMAI